MERTSKTRRKLEALSVLELGEKLVGLTEQQLREIDMPEEILREILLARTIKKHGGRKRQIQYIGGLLRKQDVGPVREAVELIEAGKAAGAHHHHQIEVWRDALVSGNDAVVDEVLQKYPAADRARISQLVREAREQNVRPHASPVASRALFRYLFSLTSSR